MALTVSLNGSNFSIPEPGEAGYDLALTQYLKALATAFPQLGVVAVQALTQELDLGPTYGVKAAWFKSQTTNPASAGQVRLAKTDSIGFRNNANSGDLALAIDAGDALKFNGANVTGNPMLGASTAAGQSIPNTTTTIVVFGTVERDSDSAYNSITGRYTVPTGKGGDYEIAGTVTWNAGVAGTSSIAIYKNGAALKLFQSVAAAAAQSVSINAIANLAAGDIIDIRLTQASGGAVVLASTATLNFFALKRIPT